jgi:arylsulfatase A-like enzyme
MLSCLVIAAPPLGPTEGALQADEHAKLKLAEKHKQKIFEMYSKKSDEAKTSPTIQPNILMFMADDLGMADTGYGGSSIARTPFLDSLAQDAVHFTNFRAEVWCSPSRASFLSGRYGWEFGTNFPDEHLNASPDHMVLMPTELHKLGYHTALVGKFHSFNTKFCFDQRWGPYNNTMADDWNTPIKFSSPENRLAGPIGGFGCGWHEQYGFVGGESGYFDDTRASPLWMRNGLKIKEHGYNTDMFAEEGSRIIQTLHIKEPSKPFFLWMAVNAPHTPYEAPNDAIQNFPADLPDEVRIYMAMIWKMDQAFENIYATVKSVGRAENTLTVFMSDNGGPVAGQQCNGNLRGGKATPFDGGTRVPFFVHWPAAIGTTHRHTNDPAHMADLMKTFLEAATLHNGTAYDKSIGNLFTMAPQSRSLLHSFKNAPSRTVQLMPQPEPANFRTSNLHEINQEDYMVLHMSASSASIIDRYAQRWKLAIIVGACLDIRKRVAGQAVGGLDVWTNVLNNFAPEGSTPNAVPTVEEVRAHGYLVQMFDLHHDPEERKDLLGHFAANETTLFLGEHMGLARQMISAYINYVKLGVDHHKVYKADGIASHSGGVETYFCNSIYHSWEPSVWNETHSTSVCCGRSDENKALVAAGNNW